VYIYQPERALLRQQVERHARRLRGLTLDIGAGELSRYRKLLPSAGYLKLDVQPAAGVHLIGSAEQLPIADAAVDSILCTQVLEHLRRPERAVAEMYRVLKPGGHCLVTVPQTNELHEEPHDYFRYTGYGLRDLFEREGFVTITCEQRGGVFSVTAQVVIRYAIDRFGLYQRPLVGRLASYAFRVVGGAMVRLDRLDRSPANRKHALGWCAVFRK
jgi:SAM-dependent methyltransferase